MTHRSSRQKTRHALVLLAIALSSFLIAYGFYLEDLSNRLCCDALQYWRISDTYLLHGLYADHPFADLRTYLYPAILLFIKELSLALGAPARLILFIIQFLLYCGSALVLAMSVCAGRPRIKPFVFALLACNIFALPYLSAVLTEAISLSFFHIWLAALIASRTQLERQNMRASVALYAIAGLTAGAACATRPAYVWLLALTPLLAALEIRRTRLAFLKMTLACALPMLALVPQIMINHRLFDSVSPLPNLNLGAKQIRWGIENLKYATAPKQGSDARMFYKNPLSQGHFRESDGIDWYWHHPLRGAATIGLKSIAAFDFDFLQPYIWNRNPPFKWLVRLISLATLILGMRGLLMHAHRREDVLLQLGSGAQNLLIFVGWAGVTLLAAVELRFTLPMLSLLLPCCVAGLLDRSGNLHLPLRQGIALGFALVISIIVSSYVADQNTLLDQSSHTSPVGRR